MMKKKWLQVIILEVLRSIHESIAEGIKLVSKCKTHSHNQLLYALLYISRCAIIIIQEVSTPFPLQVYCEFLKVLNKLLRTPLCSDVEEIAH